MMYDELPSVQTHLSHCCVFPGALLTDEELNILPFEQTYSKVNGAWNLSSDEVGRRMTASCPELLVHSSFCSTQSKCL